jgi:hypothetical protein
MKRNHAPVCTLVPLGTDRAKADSTGRPAPPIDGPYKSHQRSFSEIDSPHKSQELENVIQRVYQFRHGF